MTRAGNSDELGPESIRTANRLASNEGAVVVLTGLAVDLGGRRCVHLDRADAIVPLADGSAWGPDAGRVVTVHGRLTRHAFENDPQTGLSSLEVTPDAVQFLELPADGIIRTAPQLHAADGKEATVEGMAYRSSNGNIVVVHGGLVYVPDRLPWTKDEVTTTVRVHGVVRHGELPPEAPPAGLSWVIDNATQR